VVGDGHMDVDGAVVHEPVVVVLQERRHQEAVLRFAVSEGAGLGTRQNTADVGRLCLTNANVHHVERSGR
jgi:hypothetical protein